MASCDDKAIESEKHLLRGYSDMKEMLEFITDIRIDAAVLL